ncbi:MAG TPA: hypothetical protein PKZ36_01425 [Candidatus Paceibacterota bacterium]|nr:hypothetical protein [Candidatus Paceibacterota bacterium]HPT18047.1 hypothetical protein [Candidatus Paceibacterota bacterium]
MEPEKKSHGALIGSIIIIVILIIGGIYIWQSKVKEIQLEKEKVELQSKEAEQAYLKELQELEEDVNSANTNVDVDANKLE